MFFFFSIFFVMLKMLKFQKYLVSKNYQIKNVQFIKLFKVQNCSKCENGSKFIFFKLKNVQNLKIVWNLQSVQISEKIQNLKRSDFEK
jgi:hypothetical protein